VVHVNLVAEVLEAQLGVSNQGIRKISVLRAVMSVFELSLQLFTTQASVEGVNDVDVDRELVVVWLVSFDEFVKLQTDELGGHLRVV
jgi:hypothetical protein